MMHLIYLTTLLLPSITYAIPDALTDFAALASLVSTTATELTSSMNYPSIANASSAMNMSFVLPVGSPYPTASKIQDVLNAIDTSTSNCAANSSAFINGQAMNVLDGGYMGVSSKSPTSPENLLILQDSNYFQKYINGIPTLSQALVARGRAWHPEWNQPVNEAINNLAQAVYAYGTQLTQSDVISSGSTVRTLSAGGTLIDAQAAWDKVGTLPGRMLRF